MGRVCDSTTGQESKATAKSRRVQGVAFTVAQCREDRGTVVFDAFTSSEQLLPAPRLHTFHFTAIHDSGFIERTAHARLNSTAVPQQQNYYNTAGVEALGYSTTAGAGTNLNLSVALDTLFLTLRRPSMLVLRIRRMCWNSGEITRDCHISTTEPRNTAAQDATREVGPNEGKHEDHHNARRARAWTDGVITQTKHYSIIADNIGKLTSREVGSLL